MKIDKFIITGVSGGLGGALADSLPPKNVVGITRQHLTNKPFEVLYAELGDYITTGICTDEHCKTLKEEKIALVLCAATLGQGGGILNAKHLNDWEEVFNINVLGNLSVLKSYIPHMIKTGFGRVILLSGGGSASAFPAFSAYSLSKTAIVREAENLSMELGNLIPDFSIIALAPGAMKTKMLDKVLEAGQTPKTIVPVEETVEFIKNFLELDSNKAQSFSGRFIHVRDDLNSEEFKNKWLLRRVE